MEQYLLYRSVEHYLHAARTFYICNIHINVDDFKELENSKKYINNFKSPGGDNGTNREKLKIKQSGIVLFRTCYWWDVGNIIIAIDKRF